jgi:hypothetical protein
MAGIIPPLNIIEKLKAFKVLNSYLRYNALSSLNTASLAIHMTRIGESDDELIDILSSSLEMIANLLIRTHDLERILEFYREDLETIKVIDLLEEASKKYIAKSINFIIEGDLHMQIESYCGIIFSSIFRNAIQYRNSDQLRVIVKQKEKSVLINIIDTGDSLLDAIKSN